RFSPACGKTVTGTAGELAPPSHGVRGLTPRVVAPARRCARTPAPTVGCRRPVRGRLRAARRRRPRQRPDRRAAPAATPGAPPPCARRAAVPAPRSPPGGGDRRAAAS